MRFVVLVDYHYNLFIEFQRKTLNQAPEAVGYGCRLIVDAVCNSGQAEQKTACGF
jgi:hypothetical protein